jgi:hypothetical protein
VPLIEIHALPRPEIDRAAISRTLNAAVAKAIGARLDAVWTIWRTIDGPFVRGDETSEGAAAARFGPIVHVFHHRTPDQVERAVEAIEMVLARELAIDPGDTFITTQPVSVADEAAR